MTEDGMPDAARRAFDRHDAFAPVDDGFETTTTPFEAVTSAVSDPDEGRDARFTVTVELPTLDSATEESVAEVVEDGWFETLSLRLDDAYDAPDADRIEPPSIERDDETVTATFRFQAWSADRGVEDAKAIVDFVEGTYVQGVVPGYTYQGPVKGLLSRAREHGGDEGTGGAERGGTPL